MVPGILPTWDFVHGQTYFQTFNVNIATWFYWCASVLVPECQQIKSCKLIMLCSVLP